MEKRPSILIVCGEPSGDQHAASLVHAIKTLRPDIGFFGAGGPKMQSEGVDLLFDLTSIAVVGFFEVLKHLPTFRKVFRQLLDEAEKRKPAAAILLDYPGFNLALAKELHKRGIPVIYYISPQLWAWGKDRITAIKRDVDKMLVILPFEKEFYARENIDVSFVGHPALDSVKPSLTKAETLSRAKLAPDTFTISLLPGSREKEVRTLLPVMLETAGIIHKYMPPDSIQFLILRSASVPEAIFDEYLRPYPCLPVRTATGMTYDGVAASDFCMVCSGTATLETGILGTPMVILYKVHFLTWLYARLMIRIPFIGLVNIVKGKKVAEEFVQFDCSAQDIADTLLPVIRDRKKLADMRDDLADIRKILGEPGANRRAAEEVVSFLKNRS